MHPLFVVADASKNDNREGQAHFANERDQRDAVYLRHIQVDDNDVATVELQPLRSFESLGEELAGVALLFEIGNQELGDGGIVINEKELDGIAGKDFHIRISFIISITSISTILAKLWRREFRQAFCRPNAWS